MYYNTNEIRTNFNKNISQINDITARANSDYKTKSNTYKDLSKFILNRNLEPFKSISQEMKNLNTLLQLLTIKKRKYL